MENDLYRLSSFELRRKLSAALNEIWGIAAESQKWKMSGGVFYAVLNVGVFSVFGILKIMKVSGALLLIFLLLLIAAVIALIAVRAGKISKKEKAAIAPLRERATVMLNIPVNYRNAAALQYMVGCIDDGVASTWQECVDRYEQHVYRQTVEQNTARAAEAAEAAERAAKAAASWAAWR